MKRRLLFAIVFAVGCVVPQQQPAPAPQGAQATAPTAPASSDCQAACERMASCRLTSMDVCVPSCEHNPAAATEDGKAVLAATAKATCEQLARALGSPSGEQAVSTGPQEATDGGAERSAESEPPRAEPVASGEPVWSCHSSGAWEKCNERDLCSTQPVFGMGIGRNEFAARVMAEHNCDSHMTQLMMISGIDSSSRSRTKVHCKATRCKAP